MSTTNTAQSSSLQFYTYKTYREEHIFRKSHLEEILKEYIFVKNIDQLHLSKSIPM